MRSALRSFVVVFLLVITATAQQYTSPPDTLFVAIGPHEDQ